MIVPFPRCLPMASISSMKMMQGALARASLNKSRTRDGPTPTNISTKSDPEVIRMVKWGERKRVRGRVIRMVKWG